MNGSGTSKAGGVGLLCGQSGNVGIGRMQNGSVLHSEAQGGDGFALLDTVHKLAHCNAALTSAELQQGGGLLRDGVVNGFPVAANDSLVTAADTAETLDVLANDMDLDGGVLTVTAGGASANGAAVVNVNRTIVLDTDADHHRIATFT